VGKGKRVKSFKENSQGSLSVAYSPDGKYIATCNGIYDVSTGNMITTYSDQKEEVINIKYSPDGKYLLGGSLDKTVKLWDAETGKVVKTFVGHQEKVNSVAFSRDGKFALSGSKDNTIKLWSIESGSEIRTFEGQSANLHAFGMAGSYALRNKPLQNTEVEKTIRDFAGAPWAANSPDGKNMVVPYSDFSIRIFNKSTFQEIKRFTGHSDYIISLAYSDDGKFILSGSRDKKVKLWNVETGKEDKTLTGHQHWVNSVKFSHNGKFAASGSDDQTIKIWDIASGNEISTLRGHTSFVHSVVYSADSKWLLSGSLDKTVKLWDVATGSEIKTFKGHTTGVNAVAISPDNKYVIAGSNDNLIKLWDVSNGNEIKTFTGHTNDIVGVAFLPDGKHILSCSKDGVFKLWDIDKGNCKITYWAKDKNTWACYTPDGMFDGSIQGVKLFHFVKGMEVIPLESLYEMYFSPGLLANLLGGSVLMQEDLKIEQLKPAPEVRIISPENNSSQSQENLKITVKAADMGGGIDEIRLYHNGKLLDGTSRGFRSVGQTHEFTVTLTDGENRIKATAFNSQRTESIPDEIVVNYKAPQQVKPNIHILAVGINTYLNPKYNLNYAKNDADAFVKSLSTGASSLFGKVEVTSINDANATKTGILAALDKIKSIAKAEDVFVFYYAGHGVMSTGTDAEKPLFYLVPHDVTKMYEADEMLKKLGISANEIGEFSKNIKAQKQLFVIDACQSGGAMQTLAMRGAAEEKAIAQLARSTGTYFIAASGTEQFATEVAELGHGIFTYSVIEALKGSCKSQDGKVTVNLLKSCVEDLVPELSKKHKGQPQFPTGYGFGMDFPIVLVK
jgi:WD40 repeat protein